MKNIFCSLQKASIKRLKPFDDATILSQRLESVQLFETIELSNNKRESLTDSAAMLQRSRFANANIQSTSTTANNGGQD